MKFFSALRAVRSGRTSVSITTWIVPLGSSELDDRARRQVRRHLDEPAAQALDLQVLGLVRRRHAVDPARRGGRSPCRSRTSAPCRSRAPARSRTTAACVSILRRSLPTNVSVYGASAAFSSAVEPRNVLVNRSPSGVERQRERPRMMDVGPVADVLVRQRQHRAGPQRVARRQAARDQAERSLPASISSLPDLDGVLALDEDLEAHLARVAGPREQHRRAVEQLRVAGERRRRVEVALEREVRQLVERGVGRLQHLPA